MRALSLSGSGKGTQNIIKNILTEYEARSVNLDEYYDLTKGEGYESLRIERLDAFNCSLLDDQKKYKGFVLANSPKGNVQTVCDINFQKSKTDDRYQPRLVFRRTRQSKESTELTDVKVKADSDTRIIPFRKGTDGYRQFWEMIGFLYRFKDFVDIGKFEESFTVIATDANKAHLINQLLEKGYSEDIWKEIAIADPDLATRLSSGRLQDGRRQVVDELELRLGSSSKFSEDSGENPWQEWIYDNNWLFGVNYREPIEKEKINFVGSKPDYLFPTVDGFIDILEIKLPDDRVLLPDVGHPGAWKWTNTCNIAIGQVVNYLDHIEMHRESLENHFRRNYDISVSLIKPRAYILIGDSSKDWDSKKVGALRNMNFALHQIEVLTYADLVERGKSYIGFIG